MRSDRRTDRGRLHRWLALALLLVLAGAGVGAYSLGYLDAWTGGEQESPLGIEPPVGLGLPAVRTPRTVLEDAAGPAVSRRSLRERVEPALGAGLLGRHVGFAVRDLSHDQNIWNSASTDAFTPASSLKLFTCLTALATMEPDQTFTTSVVLAGGRVVLVGGGDPLLEPADLRRLAGKTAKALRSEDVGRVRIGFDASLFSGPAVNPAWEPGYIPDDVVSPITALWVNEGREVDGYVERVADPALVAGQVFAQALATRGVPTRGAPESAPGAGRTLASVASDPLTEIVGHVLEVSDNEGAEVLLRQVALAAGRPGSTVAGIQTVRETLSGLGVPWSGVRLLDGSGLARGNEVTLGAELALLRLASGPAHPELRPLLTSLPVAHFSGSLTYRFVTAGTADGRGYVRAKTGTLMGVRALAGVLVDRDGTVLAFVALADRIRGDETLAGYQLDEVASALAGCGCRR